MKTTELKAVKRASLGKKSTKAARKNGMIPSVLYGGKETVHFDINRIEFEKLIYTTDIFLITIDVEGSKYQAIIKDMQFHPVTDAVLHVDFLEVFDDKPVSILVPVKTKGLAKGVKAGGRLSIEQRKLLVQGLVKDIPNELIIDVTKLELAKSILVEDLEFKDLELLNAKRSVVVSVKTSRLARDQSKGADEGDDDDETEDETEETSEE